MEQKKINRSLRRGVTISVLAILFFTGIIQIYYARLMDATKSCIAVRGEMNVYDFADRIDRFFSESREVVTLTGYTLDNMIRDDRSQEDLADYIRDQAAAVSNAMPDCKTSVYAYIDETFMEGTDWQPEEGFDATQRPWYIQAKENAGAVAVVDPYQDLKTGDLTITLAKLLSDNKSVVAVDVSLKPLQDIVSSLAKEDGSRADLILDQNYNVIAFSNPGEVGKNYPDEEGTLGHAIVTGYQDAGQSGFTVTFEGTQYTVHAIPLENNWLCLSILDSTAEYGRLRLQLVVTMAVTFLFVGVMLLFTVWFGRKSLQADRLEQETENALMQNEAKTAFLTNMSHEIRTPINAVLGMNEMILRESKDQSILSYAASIKNAGRTLLVIVNDILDFSRIEAGKTKIIPDTYDLALVLHDLVEITRERTREKGLELKLDFDPEIPRRLCGDEGRVRQVILNLLSNAVKYTEKGKIVFSVSHESIPGDEENILLHVKVDDTGIGIKPEDMDRLFSEFERIEEKRNRSIEGTGLGLCITQKLLKMMGSGLEVESLYGVGSIFSFALKQKVSDKEALGDYETAYRQAIEKQATYKEKFKAPKAEVLVVDDSIMNLTVIRSLLKQTAVQMDLAESGYEGFQRAGEKKYDIIFLDHMMPDMDGIETLHEIRSQADSPNLKTPIICLTANAVYGAKEKYLAEGFDDYLTKPLNTDQLEELLLKFLPKEKIEKRQELKISAEESFEGKVPKELKLLEDTGLIDVATGLHNSGSVEAYLPLLKIYYGSMEEKTSQLEQYLADGDMKNYAIKIHALKSSSRTIGAMSLGEVAQQLEDAAKSWDMDYVRKEHKRFMEPYRSLQEPLSRVIRENENEEQKPEADEELMRDVYDEIRDAAGEMDCDRLEAVFAEMKVYRIPEAQAERWKKITEAAAGYEYDAILGILEE